MTYLDYNATTPVDARVIEVMADVYTNHPGNASSRTHLMGDDCRRIVEGSRKSIAALAGVNSSEVMFTSGATESDNIAVRGLASYGILSGRTHVIVSSIEHKAVLNAARALTDLGFDIEYAPADDTGTVSVSDVLSRIRQDTLLVSVMHVNNETGAIQPVRELGSRIREEHPDVYFHIDAAQSFGKLVDEVESLAYDMMSITAHKMYGPQGVGALVVRPKRWALPPLKPLLFGGDQEKGMRPGTLPVALIAGFGKAAELCRAEWKDDLKHERQIKASLFKALDQSGVRYQLNGNPDQCLANCCNVSFEGVSSEALMIATRGGISISNGSACTSSSYEPSYVLMSMGLGRDRAESAVRLSWGRMSDVAESDSAFRDLLEAVKQLQG